MGEMGAGSEEHGARSTGDGRWEAKNQRRRRARSAKTFLAVRRALSGASGTRNKTSPTADAFFDRTASLNGLSSRRTFLSGLGFIGRPFVLTISALRSGITCGSDFRGEADAFEEVTCDV
jgi:hypothetical protein